MRKLRDEAPAAELTILSAADPLNLVGILTRQARIPSTANNRLAFWNGNLIAYSRSEELFLLAKVNDKTKRELILGFGLPIQGTNITDADATDSSPALESLEQSSSATEDAVLIPTGDSSAIEVEEKKSPRPSFL
ncbi:MAG: hypothetical protein KDA77_07255 [Planctomycetaceae bacterium]|nr:hypothetical protein [Planctomycetaceae bacterium]